MDQVSPYLHDIVSFFRDGFRDGFAHVNGALGIIIAVFVAYELSEWRRLWAGALGATVLHLAAVVMIPSLSGSPELLSLALALWVGACLYLSLMDRSARSSTRFFGTG